ncbi:MAG: lipid A deacylase LpxR family protein [Alphaproteobacteria bacterium]
MAATVQANAQTTKDTYSVQWENDRIANTDRHYTNGFRLSWVSGARDDDPIWVKDVLETLYPFASLRQGRVGAAFGQSIFTPENTTTSGLVTDDRPYAGWLYGAISVHAETRRDPASSSTNRLDTVELNLGIVGPLALGRQVQNGVHDLINVGRSNGWGHQLDNEPGVMLIGERRWRPDPWNLFGVEVGAIPHIGGSVGNVMTFASAGAILRVGQNLDVDYGPPLIRPSLSGLAAVDKQSGLAWYAFAGIQVRGVAHDIFLDGNTFARSHSVDKRHLVGDAQVGLAFIYRGVRLAVTQILRTREFEGQRQADRFGAISLSANF